jgi:hypothetical protein
VRCSCRLPLLGWPAWNLITQQCERWAERPRTADFTDHHGSGSAALRDLRCDRRLVVSHMSRTLKIGLKEQTISWRVVAGPTCHFGENTIVMANSPLAGGSSLLPAVFGLAGALIGGIIAGAVSLLVARQAREAAERAWIRDNRREIYDRFLTYAQRLLIACEAYKDARRQKEAAKASVESAFTSFWEVYGVVQTVAGNQLFEAARIYGYRLWELATSLGSTSVMGPENFSDVA